MVHADCNGVHADGGFDATPTEVKPWELSHDRRRVYIRHPPGPKTPGVAGFHKLHIHLPNQTPMAEKSWIWNGDTSAPSLIGPGAGSILCIHSGWHGYLRAGRMVPA